MVICVGIPYPNILDIKVQLKKIFLEEKNKNGISEYNSNQWCKEEAFIAINQSLGRLIRHKDDYGIMICFGNEFKDNSLFTEWIKQNEKIIQLKDNNKEYYKELENYLLYMDKNDKYYKCFKTIIDLDNSSSEDIMYEYDNSYESDDIENDCYDEENEYE
jgi:Rad3-related DNA helicase